MQFRIPSISYGTALVTLVSSLTGFSYALPANATPGFSGGSLVYIDDTVYDPGNPNNMQGNTVGYVAVRPNDPAIYRTVFQPEWLTSNIVPSQVSDVLTVCQLQFPGTYAALSMNYYRWGQAHRSQVGIPTTGGWLSYYCITPPQPNDSLVPRPGDRGAIAYWYGKVNKHWSSSTGGWVNDPDAVSGGNIGTLAYCRRWYPGTNSVYHLGNDRITNWKNRGNVGSFTGVGMVYVCDPNPPPAFPQNYPPEAYDQSVTTPAGVALTITLQGFDIDGDDLTYSIVAQPTHGTLGSISGSQVVYTPEAGFSGVDGFTFAANDGQAQSPVGTITITVLGGQQGNGSPVAEGGLLEVEEDESSTVTLLATDPDSDPLTFSIITLPSHGSLGIVVGNQVTYTPASNYFGSDSFSFVAHDATSTSNVATINVTVTPVNDAPVAYDTEATTTMNQLVTITVLANDIDGDSLAYSIANQPEHGTATMSGAVSILGAPLTYMPEPDFFGTDSFTFVASDGQVTSTPATVTVTVEYDPSGEENVPPMLEDYKVTTDEDTVLEFTLEGGDLDGDSLTYGLVTPPAHGTAIVDDQTGLVTYTPAPNYFGVDSFTADTFDSFVSSSPATISITVTPVNDAPTAANLAATTTAETPVTLAFEGTDIDGDDLTFTVLTLPSHGTLSATTTTSTLVYTPAAEFLGEDNFTFSSSDGATSSAAATVTITVTPGQILLPPTATPPPGDYPGGQSIALTATSSESIHYTIDGREPTCTSGIVYDGTIPVTSNITIRAIACYENGGSVVVDLPYTITPPSGGGGGGGGAVLPVQNPPQQPSSGAVLPTTTAITTPEPRVLAISDRVCRTPEIEKQRQVGVKPDQALITRLSGRILLQVDGCGEAWYLDPVSRKRYYLQPGSQAYIALHQFGVGVTDKVANTIPVANVSEYSETDTDGDGLSDKAEIGLGTDPINADTDSDGHSDGMEVLNGYSATGPGRQQYDPAFIKRMLGRIILQVHRNGEAWYIYPVNKKRYYLHNGTSAYGILKQLSLGISDADLAKIPVGDLDIKYVAPGDLEKVPTGGRP